MFIYIYIILLIIMVLILRQIDILYRLRRSGSPIGDRFHEFFGWLLPQTENWLFFASNWMIYILIGICIYCVWKYDRSMIVLDTYLKTHIILLYIRLFIVYATDYPACKALDRPISPLDSATIDTMYSGHVLMVFMLVMYINNFINLGIYKYMIIGLQAILLVAAKIHYTADVVVSMVIGYYAFT